MSRSKEFETGVVIERAMSIFWTRGFASTSTQELVDSMRIGKRSLYDTFGSKRELYLRCLKEYVSRADASEAALLDEHPDTEEHVRKLLLNAVVLTNAETPPGCFAVNASIEQGPLDADTQSCVVGYFTRRTDRISRALRLGGRDEESAAALAAVIQSSWIGLRAQALAGQSDEAQRQLTDRIAALSR